MKDYVDQKINTISEKNEVETKQEETTPVIRKVINLPKSKPKTASAVHHKPEKSLKIRKKTQPIRLDSFKKTEEPVQLEPIKTIDETRYDRQTQLCKELCDMYETELKRIYEIKARKTQILVKPQNISRKAEEHMRRTGGGFMPKNYFNNNK